METMQTIKDRRAVRSFTRDLVAKEQVEVLIDAATWAPSDLNRQPWSFVVIQGTDRLADLEEKARADWLGTGGLARHERPNERPWVGPRDGVGRPVDVRVRVLLVSRRVDSDLGHGA